MEDNDSDHTEESSSHDKDDDEDLEDEDDLQSNTYWTDMEKERRVTAAALEERGKFFGAPTDDRFRQERLIFQSDMPLMMTMGKYLPPSYQPKYTKADLQNKDSNSEEERSEPDIRKDAVTRAIFAAQASFGANGRHTVHDYKSDSVEEYKLARGWKFTCFERYPRREPLYSRQGWARRLPEGQMYGASYMQPVDLLQIEEFFEKGVKISSDKMSPSQMLEALKKSARDEGRYQLPREDEIFSRVSSLTQKSKAAETNKAKSKRLFQSLPGSYKNLIKRTTRDILATRKLLVSVLEKEIVAALRKYVEEECNGKLPAGYGWDEIKASIASGRAEVELEAKAFLEDKTFIAKLEQLIEENPSSTGRDIVSLLAKDTTYELPAGYDRTRAMKKVNDIRTIMKKNKGINAKRNLI